MHESSVTSRAPALDSAYPVSAGQRAAFERDGHIVLRNVASAEEIAFFRPAINRTSDRYCRETRNLEDRDTYGKAFLQITNLWERDDTVKKFVFARRFARVAAGLLGVERVRLYHDQALYKEPLGGHTPWHQDKFYWNLDTDKMITMWMPLVGVTAEMGTMNFAAGSHKTGMAENVHISDESEEIYKKYIAEKGFPISRTGFLQAGDASFHHCRTIHSAGGNHSETVAREAMTVIYFADGAKITAPVNEFQKADHARWLGNIEPGKLADGPLNPLL